MPLSVVDLYQKILPKTNCGDCGYATCLAFASMVVSEKLALRHCPHVESHVLETAQAELDDQHAAGKWTKKDMAADALQWAKERAAAMQIEALAERLGGQLVKIDGDQALELPYFDEILLIRPDQIIRANNEPLGRWEQVFIFNHMAQGGHHRPTGKWKGLIEFPNTVSKIISMQDHVEKPLIDRFSGHAEQLRSAATAAGGREWHEKNLSADVVLRFLPLPRIPVLLLFWDEEQEEGYRAEVKLLFDETITEHLDIESILFLSERIKELIMENASEGIGS